MAATPLVTIGLPFRNPGRHFIAAIQSIFAQTLGDWELLLIDDGSSDGSAEIAAMIADPRVTFISDGKSMGLGPRLNQISHEARGRFVCRMDADDIMHPERVFRQVSYLELAADVDVVVGSAAFALDSENRVTGLRESAMKVGKGWAARNAFIHPTVMAHRSWFTRYRYTEEPLFLRCEDAELWCRSSNASTFTNIAEPLLFLREVGVFSWEKYVWTQAGMAALLTRHEDGSARAYVQALASIAVKLFVTGSAQKLGVVDRLVKLRAIPLERGKRREAQQLLNNILSTRLPGIA